MTHCEHEENKCNDKEHTCCAGESDQSSCLNKSCSTGRCSPCLYIWGAFALFLLIQLAINQLK
jgi:hypothetical protein